MLRPAFYTAIRRTAHRHVLLLTLCACSVPVEAAAQRTSRSTLSSPGVGTWWTTDSSHATSSGPVTPLAHSIAWGAIHSAVDTASLVVEVNGGPLRLHVVLVRFDPRKLRPSLAHMTDASRVRGTWTVDSAPADAVVAFNAGQFEEAGPWGWIVRAGRESALPGGGPLATGIAFDTAGSIVWLDSRRLSPARRPDPRAFDVAFQSYPLLLRGGAMPDMVRTGRGIDSDHRDARLALCTLRDGRAIVALTRFGARETVLSRVPLGLTVIETAALMGSLGCTDAVMLDGGLSAQLMVRSGELRTWWRGGRRVPLGLVLHDR